MDVEVAGPAQLVPVGGSAVQTFPDFTGVTSGALNTGHLIWLPDGDLGSGFVVNYSELDAGTLPTIYVHGGVDATPTQTATNALPGLKDAMRLGKLPLSIVVFVNTADPDDSVQGWGMNAADGSYPLETMLVFDLPSEVSARTKARNNSAARCRIGFSKGGFEVLRLRAKFDFSDCCVYVVAGAPRLDADFPTPAATYATFSNPSAAVQQAKLFNSSSAICQQQSPIANSAGTALFNVYGSGTAPLLIMESDDGVGANGDTTARGSLNNAINTRLPALGVPFVTTNLFSLVVVNQPTHNFAQYMTAWAAVVATETTFGAATVKDLGWIKVRGGAYWN